MSDLAMLVYVATIPFAIAGLAVIFSWADRRGRK